MADERIVRNERPEEGLAQDPSLPNERHKAEDGVKSEAARKAEEETFRLQRELLEDENRSFGVPDRREENRAERRSEPRRAAPKQDS